MIAIPKIQGFSEIHVIGAPKIDEDDDKDVIKFVDQYITCSIPVEKYSKLNGLVKKMQTYHGTTTGQKRKVLHVDLMLLGHPLKKHLCKETRTLRKQSFL